MLGDSILKWDKLYREDRPMATASEKYEQVITNVREHIEMLGRRLLEEQNAIQVACERLDEFRDMADFKLRLLMVEKEIGQFRKTEHELKIWNGYKGVIFKEVR